MPKDFEPAIAELASALRNLIRAEMSSSGDPNTVHFLVSEERRLYRLERQIKERLFR